MSFFFIFWYFLGNYFVFVGTRDPRIYLFHFTLLYFIFIYLFIYRTITFSIFTSGWSGDAMRRTTAEDSRARAHCACSGCGWGLFGLFFFISSVFSLFFLPLFGRRPDID